MSFSARFPLLRRSRRYGFTLIELMVVIAIIALLIAILLPSLQAARQHAKNVHCGSNLHHVGLAVANYLFSSNGTYPPSYAYPTNEDGFWTPKEQSNTKPFGYIHWSHFMYQSGEVGHEAFQCPNADHGGAPRTNPGLEPRDWEAGQVDQNGDKTVNELEDKQAPRMSYTANATIMPRNKFTSGLSGGQRVNVFVKESEIKRIGDTILVTEFLDNWKALGVQQGDGIESKSHRPISPFLHVGSGGNEYKAPPSAPGFIYGTPTDQDTYGLLPLSEVRTKVNILDYTSGIPQINAIGRHHPTVDAIYRERFGGSTNFLFGDAHVENMTIIESVAKRKWGDRYYGISGRSEVMNMSKVYNVNGRP